MPKLSLPDGNMVWEKQIITYMRHQFCCSKLTKDVGPGGYPGGNSRLSMLGALPRCNTTNFYPCIPSGCEPVERITVHMEVRILSGVPNYFPNLVDFWISFPYNQANKTGV